MGAAVVLDPGIMVLRLGRTSAEETYAVVESLLAWAGLLDEDWVTVLPSKRAAEALAGDDLYPGRHDLTEAFDAYGVIEYSVNDVMHVMDRFLSMAPSFEEHCRVEYVWLDEEEVATQPDVLGVQQDLASGRNWRAVWLRLQFCRDTAELVGGSM